MPRKRRYYNPWGQGGYEFDKWLYNLAPAEGQNAYQAQEAYNAYAKNSESGMQGNAQNYGEAGLQSTFQNMLSTAWEAERDNAQAAINEASLQQGATPLAKWMRKIDGALYSKYITYYYNILLKRNNYNCIIIHRDSSGNFVQTPVDFVSGRLATTYIVVSDKFYSSDWDGQHGAASNSSFIISDEINTIINFPFFRNSDVAGPNANVTTNGTTVNVPTTNIFKSISNILIATPSLTITISANTALQTAETLVSNDPTTPFTNRAAHFLIDARYVALRSSLTTNGVPSEKIISGPAGYNKGNNRTTITLEYSQDTKGLNDVGLSPTNLVKLPKSGYSEAPKTRP